MVIFQMLTMTLNANNNFHTVEKNVQRRRIYGRFISDHLSTWISKANQAFALLKSTWRSTGLNIHTKIGIFNGNVLSVLLYGSECWKTSRSFQNQMPSKHPQDLLANRLLVRRAAQKNWDVYNIGDHPKRRLGHVLRNSLHRVALRWIPQGKRNWCRQNETWRRTVLKDLKIRGLIMET